MRDLIVVRRKEELKKLKFNVLSIPPYSPDVALADLAIYPRMKRLLRGEVFENCDCLKSAVHFFLIFPVKTSRRSSTMRFNADWSALG